MLLVVLMMTITNTQVSWFRKAFGNNLSANIKLLQAQLYKMGQSTV